MVSVKEIYIYIYIINGNFELVKNQQKSPRFIGARVLFIPFGLISSHKLKPNWVGPKG